MKLDFEEIYKETKEDLQEAERIRRKNLPIAIMASLLVLIVPGWLIWSMAMVLIDNVGDVSEWQMIFVFLFTAVSFFAIYYFCFHEVRFIFKEKVIPKIVDKIGESFYYTPEDGVNRSLGDQSKLLPKGVWLGKDHVIGKIDGDLLEFSNLKIKSSAANSSSDSKRSQSTHFKGVFVHLELSYKLPDPVWIIHKKAISWYESPQLKEVKNRTVLRLEGLHRKYRLHTTNEAMAKQLFTDKMLSTINELIAFFKEKKVGKKLGFAFFENHICIAIKRKRGIFTLSWMPFFTNLDSPKFIEKQLLVLNAVLELRLAFLGERDKA